MADGRDEAEDRKKRSGDEKRNKNCAECLPGSALHRVLLGSLREEEGIAPGDLEHRLAGTCRGDELQIMVGVILGVACRCDCAAAYLKVPDGYLSSGPVTEIKPEAGERAVLLVEPQREGNELVLLEAEVLPYREVLRVALVEAIHNVEDLGLHHARVVRPDVGAHLIGGVRGEEVESPAEEEHWKRDIKEKERVEEEALGPAHALRLFRGSLRTGPDLLLSF